MKQILTGKVKSFKLGSKGNRYKITIDDVKISNQIQTEITEAQLEDPPIKLSVDKIIRGQNIEVRFLK